MSLMRTLTVILLVYFTQAREDYWDEDFDENKNCVREEEMMELQRETEPGRCASATGSGINMISPLYLIFNFLPRISQNTVGGM